MNPYNCLHFHKGALACKLDGMPCAKILWKGNPCSNFEPSPKKKKADSKVKKVSVIKESKIKDKKDNNIKKKQIPNPNKDLITDIKKQISLTLEPRILIDSFWLRHG